MYNKSASSSSYLKSVEPPEYTVVAHRLESKTTGVASSFDVQLSTLTGQYFQVSQRTGYIFGLVAVTLIHIS